MNKQPGRQGSRDLEKPGWSKGQFAQLRVGAMAPPSSNDCTAVPTCPQPTLFSGTLAHAPGLQDRVCSDELGLRGPPTLGPGLHLQRGSAWGSDCTGPQSSSAGVSRKTTTVKCSWGRRTRVSCTPGASQTRFPALGTQLWAEDPGAQSGAGILELHTEAQPAHCAQDPRPGRTSCEHPSFIFLSWADPSPL